MAAGLSILGRQDNTRTLVPAAGIFFRKAWAVFKRDIIESLSYKASFLFDLSGILANTLIFFFVAKLFSRQADPYLERYGGSIFRLS